MSEALQTFRMLEGSGPLILSIPHAGTGLPDFIKEKLTDHALSLPDTDWRVDRLYGFLADFGIPTLIATQSRMVVDLNRPPDGADLYPSEHRPGLVPLTSFEGERLYGPGQEPGEGEIGERVANYWQPYHRQLSALLEAAKKQHGYAILWDAHSIRSRVPALFDGKLPHLNWGTNDGASAHPKLAKTLHQLAQADGKYSSVIDGRFKGGYITRNYGNPDAGVHAIQLEMSFEAYLDEEKNELDAERLAGLLPLLRTLVEAARIFNPKT